MSPLWLLSLIVPLISCVPAPSLFLLGDSLPSFKELLTRPSGRPLTISVEGNVGAGKSTLLNYFKQHSQVTHMANIKLCQVLKEIGFSGRYFPRAPGDLAESERDQLP